MSEGPGISNREASYYKMTGTSSDPNPFLSNYYTGELHDVPVPKDVKTKGPDGKEIEHKANKRKGRPSIFNRYCMFYYNSIEGHGVEPEPYMDQPDRLAKLSTGGAVGWQSVIENPSAKNIISWSQQGGAGKGTNAIEYAWEDFLWCKNYGLIPNNYLVTMRRFPIAVSDDLLDNKKQPTPDIGRMITWVDGEINTWETVGLKFSTSLTWKKMESEIQSLTAQQGYGNEGGALGGTLGNIVKSFSSMTQPGHNAAMTGYNANASSVDPYANKNVVFGPIDVIKEMMVRDKGLNFEQEMTLKFQYELRSIDGINPKVAMIDLISNILVCTANRGEWWGGEVRYHGGNPRHIQPLGDPSKLASGDYAGYFSSLVSGLSQRMNNLTGGAGISLEGVGNAIKNIGGGLMANIVGGGLDKMGRPGAQAVNSLLSGEDTGEWHVTVGNPANPIISVGNMILEKTEIFIHGPLGADDFPTKVDVTCVVKPARPRDRTDIMSMFHRNGRTYVQVPPSAKKYAGNSRGGKNGGMMPKGDHKAFVNQSNLEDYQGMDSSIRFPNHSSSPSDGSNDFVLDNSAQGIF
jgi:hypothetical protein